MQPSEKGLNLSQIGTSTHILLLPFQFVPPLCQELLPQAHKSFAKAKEAIHMVFVTVWPGAYSPGLFVKGLQIV
jgi:hypothetical protein